MRREHCLRMYLLFLIAGVMWILFSPLYVEAKGRKHLSVKDKNLSIGQECTIRLKGLSSKDKKKGKKVIWKVSGKKVIMIKKKTQYSITIKARKSGKVKIFGIYRGKKYTCKVTVWDNKNVQGEDEETDDLLSDTDKKISLNATEVSMYYLGEEERKYLSPLENHIYSYQFRVEGLSEKKAVRWSIESTSTVSAFKVENGLVYMWRSPSYDRKIETATLVATFENGSRFTAKLVGYSEKNVAVENIIDDFVSDRIKDGMSEYEKINAVASYVSSEYEYQMYQPDWMMMVLGGSGDCFSSRYLVKYLCDAVGVKALACVGEQLDGMTLAKADGKMYVIMTGFNDEQPRKYLIYEASEETLKSIVTRSHIDLSYFDIGGGL